MATPFRWTVDCESDWGGRTESTDGVRHGLPIILELFRERNIKALFFFSTELLENFTELETGTVKLLKLVMSEGHAIGSHGHFHTRYPSINRYTHDRRLSTSILENLGVAEPQYRAPKFNKFTWSFCRPYSDPQNHIGLLKMMWFGAKPTKDTIFYLHPFDITGSKKDPPNLFCGLWYSKPNKALHLLKNLIQKYPGSQRLK
mgnify:CR=1 FL=1